MGRSADITRLTLELSRDQFGAVSRKQLLAAGIKSRTIDDRIVRSVLFPVYPGVYLVGRPHLTTDGLLMASPLATGEGAVLGGRTAASVLGIMKHHNLIEVIRTRGATIQRALLRVDGERWWPYLLIHETRRLQAADLGTAGGLPLTSPARTLRDLAAVLPKKQFHRAFTEADRLELLDDRSLEACAKNTQGRRGGGTFRRAIERRLPGVEEAESILETMVLRI